jgi:uncharacterized protein
MTTRPEDESQLIRYSWDEMDRFHRDVARQILSSGFGPDVIVGIMRCGQVPAIHLSYILGIRKVTSIAVKTTPSDAPLADRIDPEVTIFVPDTYLRNQRVLLVDAVMESGTTAELCLRELARFDPAEIRVAMITDWYNSSYKIASGQRPAIDFAGERVTLWPDFPWEH